MMTSEEIKAAGDISHFPGFEVAGHIPQSTVIAMKW